METKTLILEDKLETKADIGGWCVGGLWELAITFNEQRFFVAKSHVG